MQREGPPREPDDLIPPDLVSRIRGPAGETLEAAELRIPPAELGKLREVVTARGGAVMPAAEHDPSRPAGSLALIHPMDKESGMYLVDLRSPEPGWIAGMLIAFRDVQML